MSDSDEMIKLHLNGEGFWATPLGDGRFRVENCTVCNDFSLKDIIDAQGNILEKYGRNGILEYEYPENNEEQLEAVYKELYEYLEDKGVLVEGFMVGTAGITVPKSISEEQLIDIVNNAPSKCKAVLAEEGADQ